MADWVAPLSVRLDHYRKQRGGLSTAHRALL